MRTDIDTTSPLVKANLAFRFLLEVFLFGGIVLASIANYDGTTTWIAATIGVVLATTLWGVFAVPNDPSRSGKTVIKTPGPVRLLLELSLFAVVTAWLATGEQYVVAGLLAAGTIIHYALWPQRIRWLLANR